MQHYQRTSDANKIFLLGRDLLNKSKTSLPKSSKNEDKEQKTINFIESIRKNNSTLYGGNTSSPPKPRFNCSYIKSSRDNSTPRNLNNISSTNAYIKMHKPLKVNIFKTQKLKARYSLKKFPIRSYVKQYISFS